MANSHKIALPALPDKAPGVPKGNRYKKQYGVIVLLADEAAQKDAFSRLTADGYKCRVVTT